MRETAKGASESTILQIEQISTVIHDVDEIVYSIASAVDEQSITTKEISENISQISVGFQGINENVVESSNVAERMAKDISDVSIDAGIVSESSVAVNSNVSTLTRFASQLKAMLAEFKV